MKTTFKAIAFMIASTFVVNAVQYDDLALSDLQQIKQGQTVHGFKKYVPAGDFNPFLSDGSAVKHQYNFKKSIACNIEENGKYIAILKIYYNIRFYIGLWAGENNPIIFFRSPAYEDEKDDEDEKENTTHTVFLKKSPLG